MKPGTFRLRSEHATTELCFEQISNREVLKVSFPVQSMIRCGPHALTMADSGRHILTAVKKICTSFFVQTVHVQNSPIVYKCVNALFVHVQNPPIVYKCVHTLFVHLYMYKILRSYTNMYMHYLYICTCTKRQISKMFPRNLSKHVVLI